MDLLEMVLGKNRGAVGAIARKLGVPEPVAQLAIGALLPALTKGIQSNAAKPGGMESLLGALGSGNHQRYVDEPETLADEATVEDGNAILGHVLGSKDVSRSVAAQASSQTGVDVQTLKKMLPMVGALAMGTVSRETNAGASLASQEGSPADPLTALSGLLGGGEAETGGLLGAFKKVLDSRA